MGMYVSQLRSVPVGLYEYYLYLIDASDQGAHSPQISKFFDRVATAADVDSVIVRGPRDLSDEVIQFLRVHAQFVFYQLQETLMQVTCLLASEGALQETTKQLYVLPLLERHEDEKEQPLLEPLLTGLLTAMREHRLAEWCRSLGAIELRLDEIKGGVLVATLRYVNDVLELKPGIAGLGVNINAIIEKSLGPLQRNL